MRKTLMALAVLSILALPAAAQAAPADMEAPAPATEAAPAPEATAGVEAVAAPERTGTPVEAAPQSLPSCWNYEGNSCSTPGTRIRCQWIQYEPGICVCQQNYTWNCF